VVEMTATTGIAATLLRDGKTFHQAFCVPLAQPSSVVFPIRANSSIARRIRKIDVVVVDEAPMMQLWHIEGLDRTLRDLCREPSLPFGGKVVLLAGDWRQCLPVVQHARGDRAIIIENCILRASQWRHFLVSHLETNHRCDDTEFAALALAVGNGLPHALRPEWRVSSTDNLINQVFSDGMLETKGRAILCSRNPEANQINNICASRIQGDAVVLLSSDTMGPDENGGQGYNLPVEYLNSLEVTGLPPHKLSLKRGMPLMLMRTISHRLKRMNGTRVTLVDFVGSDPVMALKVRHEVTGEEFFLPRFDLTPADGLCTFQWRRRQFPVMVCYAITCNKAQGQGLTHVGIDISGNPFFSHGQAYVASKNPANLYITGKWDPIVWEEVLLLAGHQPNPS
jgi:hypothetical protein